MDLSVVPYSHHTSSDTDHDSPGAAIEIEPKPSAADTSRSRLTYAPSDSNNSPPPVKFKECMRNHAASIGGHANDGCGEFMPRALDGTRDSLTCAACGCHRNFHRREISGGCAPHLPLHHPHPPPPSHMVLYNTGPTTPRWDKNVLNNPTTALPLFQQQNLSARRFQYNRNGGDHHHHHLMGAADEGDHQDQDHEDNAEAYDRRSETPEREGNVTPGGGTGRTAAMMMRSKRFRTKFTQEQKDRMLEFAERIGWRIQRNDDGVLNQFCNEVGVKRNVLKVWMHNNKNAHRRRELSLQSPMSAAAAADPPPAPPQQSHPPQPIGV